MEITSIEHGRDGNINSLVNVAAKFDQIRQAYKEREFVVSEILSNEALVVGS